MTQLEIDTLSNKQLLEKNFIHLILNSTAEEDKRSKNKTGEYFPVHSIISKLSIQLECA